MEKKTWIDFKNEKNYNESINNIKNYIKSISSDEIEYDYFTPHDYDHCKAVECIIFSLIEKSEIISKINLSEFEIFILQSCVWTHDIGMFDSSSLLFLGENYSPTEKRKKHEIISAWYLNKDDSDFRKLFKEFNEDIITSYIHTINIISKYHRRSNDIKGCPEARYLNDELIRTRLLACLLRLGDTLHIDSSRYDRKLYNIMQIGNFDRTARLHWIKSYVVSSVNLDINKQIVWINLDLPEPEFNYPLAEGEINDINDTKEWWNESSKRLEFIIRDNVYEDLIAVYDTFRHYNIKFYNTVIVKTNYCPGYDKKRRDDVRQVLNDLDILLSPNTSKVIKKTIDSLNDLSSSKGFRSFYAFKRQTRQLIDHLKKIINSRPCHVGLRKIINELDEIFRKFPEDTDHVPKKDITNYQTLISNFTQKISNNKKVEIEEIKKQSAEILKDIKNIILFGFSETVSLFLDESKNDFKSKVNIYIFECAGKRQFSHTNTMEYNDGIHYALHLNKLGFKNIHILPETSFCSLVRDEQLKNKINKKNTIVLFGANGIDIQDESCGHTSGHLLIAIIAKHFEIPIKIISERFKDGEIIWNSSLKRNDSCWLTGNNETLSELASKDIKLINYREDRIDRKYYDGRITSHEPQKETT